MNRLVVYCFKIKLEFGSVDFCGGEKLEKPEKSSWSNARTKEQTQPTCDARILTKVTLVRG